MRTLVLAAALVAFSALPALAAGCSYSSGKQQTVQADTKTSTQTATTQQSVPVPESAK